MIRAGIGGISGIRIGISLFLFKRNDFRLVELITGSVVVRWRRFVEGSLDAGTLACAGL